MAIVDPRPQRYRSFLAAYLLALLTFVALDAVWLSATATPVYRHALGPLLRHDFAALPAALFYALYCAGLVVLAIAPAARAPGAAWRGALFGCVAYATYDLTNQATLQDWPSWLTAIDLLWGTVVSAISCAVARRYMPTQPPINPANRPSKRNGPPR